MLTCHLIYHVYLKIYYYWDQISKSLISKDNFQKKRLIDRINCHIHLENVIIIINFFIIFYFEVNQNEFLHQYAANVANF
jgi:hypothetical protein